MSVVAEGIETEAQARALIACGVEEGQGYLVAAPLPLPKFLALIEARRPAAGEDMADDALVALSVYFIIWPRNSPPGLPPVWMFAYHLPASRSAACDCRSESPRHGSGSAPS